MNTHTEPAFERSQAWAWMDRFFRDLWNIITRPTAFFARMPREGGITGPLVFALITHWLGAAIEFLWQSATGGAMLRVFNDLFQVAGEVADVDHPGRAALLLQARDRLAHWIWGTGAVLLDPFLTMASILFTSWMVFVGARLLVTPGRAGAPDRIRFETALRIVCYGMSPAILAAVPFIGLVISKICVVIVTVIGAREVYRTGTARATAIALFPKLLFLAILLSGFLLFAVLVIQGLMLLF